MSVEMMSLVWRAALPPNEKLVALAYADHADNDGKNIFPSYATIAKKTSYTRRQAINITSDLKEDRGPKTDGKFPERKKILIHDGSSKYGTNRFKLNISELKALDSDNFSPPASEEISPPASEEISPPSEISSPPSEISDINSAQISPESSFNRHLTKDEKILNQVKDTLKSEMPLAEYNRRIKPLFFFEDEKENGTIVYAQNDPYTTDWLSQRLTTRVNQIIRGAYNSPEISVMFQTSPTPKE